MNPREQNASSVRYVGRSLVMVPAEGAGWVIFHARGHQRELVADLPDDAALVDWLRADFASRLEANEKIAAKQDAQIARSRAAASLTLDDFSL